MENNKDNTKPNDAPGQNETIVPEPIVLESTPAPDLPSTPTPNPTPKLKSGLTAKEPIKSTGILSQKAVETVEKLKKNFMKIGVYILIGGIILGALLILIGNTAAGEYIGKTMGMLIVIAIMMLISSNNFKMLETGKKEVQIFALIGLITNIIWGIMWTLMIWGVFETTYEVCSGGGAGRYPYYTSRCNTDFTIMWKIATISTHLSILGLFGSNILNIDNRDRKGAIMPLKITAIVALCYDVAYGIIMTIIGFNAMGIDQRAIILAGFAFLVLIITWIVAAVLSRGSRKKAEKEATATLVASAMKAQTETPVESEEEMRKRIEEKVKKEMEMEKEIRAKMESENQTTLSNQQNTNTSQTDEVHDIFQTD